MRAIAADIEPPRIAAAPAVWTLPDRGVVGMVSFIIAESAIFTIFVVAYLFYLGKSLTGPTPRDVLEVPIFYTICLLSSSVTIHLAGQASRAQRVERVPRAVADHDRAWGHLHVRHGAGMAPADLRTRPDDFHESVRHDLLLARRPARVSRHARPRHAHDRRSWLGVAGRVRRTRPGASTCCRSTGTSSTSCGLSCSPSCTSSAAEQKPWQA